MGIPSGSGSGGCTDPGTCALRPLAGDVHACAVAAVTSTPRHRRLPLQVSSAWAGARCVYKGAMQAKPPTAWAAWLCQVLVPASSAMPALHYALAERCTPFRFAGPLLRYHWVSCQPACDQRLLCCRRVRQACMLACRAAAGGWVCLLLPASVCPLLSPCYPLPAGASMLRSTVSAHACRLLPAACCPLCAWSSKHKSVKQRLRIKQAWHRPRLSCRSQTHRRRCGLHHNRVQM